MEIGVYLPNLLPGVGVCAAAEWARRAESLGFDVLALTSEGADEPAQPFEAAEAAVAVTDRIPLFGDIVYGASWRPDVHAEHTALLDELTGGRYTSSLTLPDDLYTASGLGPVELFRRLNDQLAELRRVRRTLPPSGRPLSVLVGGPTDLIACHIAHHGDGWFQRAGTPEHFAAGLELVATAWAAEGRRGRPTGTAAFHYALGDDALAAAEALHARYNAVRGPLFAGAVIAGSATDEAEIRDRVAAFAAAGADRVLAVPAVADIEQLDRFAAASLPQPLAA